MRKEGVLDEFRSLSFFRGWGSQRTMVWPFLIQGIKRETKIASCEPDQKESCCYPVTVPAVVVAGFTDPERCGWGVGFGRHI